jgi:hypothetical protein
VSGDYFAFSGNGGVSVAVMDYNRDGYGDVVAENLTAYSSGPRWTSGKLLTHGPGAPSVLVTYQNGGRPAGQGNRLFAKDLDGDGAPELLITTRFNNQVRRYEREIAGSADPLYPLGTPYMRFVSDIYGPLADRGVWVG